MFKAHETFVRRLELSAGLLLTLIIVFLHLTFIRHAGAFWRDEANSINLAAMAGLSDVWHSLGWDSFPVLFSLVLRLWVGIGGGSELGLRILGFLIGASILGLLWLNLRLLGNFVPLISLSLFALSPLVIRIGDSVRPYGLGIFLILLTFALLWKVTCSPSRRYVVAAMLVAVLSVQCLFQNAFLLTAVIFAGVIVNIRNGRWKSSALLIAIGTIAALSLLPYWTILERAQDWMVILQVPSELILVWPVLSRALGAPGQFVIWIWMGFFVLGLCTAVYLQLPRLGRDVLPVKRDLVLYCSIAMAAGTAVLLFFLKITNIPPQSWYYLLMMALAAVSLDSILANTNSGRILRIALVILMCSLSLPAVWDKVHERQTNVDLIASELAESAGKDDMILMNPWYLTISFQRYYDGAADVMMLPPLEPVKIHRYDLVKRKMAFANPMEPILSQIAETLKSGNKVWVVGRLNFILEDSTSPRFLPPAPNSPYGWSYGSYMQIWREQIGHFIQSHALKGNVLPRVTDGPVSLYENCSVMSLHGWQQ